MTSVRTSGPLRAPVREVKLIYIRFVAWFGMTAALCAGASGNPIMQGSKLPATTARAAAAAASTRALFTYTRDDASPGKVTRVRIDASVKATAPVSQDLFGNFLEHLGGAIYDVLWADALRNPGLEQIDPAETAPSYWQLAGAAEWTHEGYFSPRAVRLAPPPSGSPAQTGAPASAPASLSQDIYLPVHRIGRYTGSLFLRAPETSGHLVITLTPVADPGGQSMLTAAGEKPVLQSVLYADRPTWRKLAFPVLLPTDASLDAQGFRLTLSHRDGGPIDVDEIELFPDDNVFGMDPEVVERARELQIPVLRYPGGNFASGYHWQDGLGMRERRPTRRNAAWGGVETNHFGINEFIRLSRLCHARQQLVVNAGDGTPEEAAAWVSYCNATPRNRYGYMRASNASPEPYDVDLWEIGNELYGGWQIGHTDAVGNAARFVAFRNAMLAADPAIKLIATGKGEEFTPDGLQRDREWNEALLNAAAANGGRPPDYVSIHPLVPLPAAAGTATYAEQYESALAFPAWFGQTLLPAVAAQIAAVEGPNARTRIAATEWGIIVGGRGWRSSPNHDTLAGALFNALSLNAMLRNSDLITLANMTALAHGGGVKKSRSFVYVDPQYYTQQLYAEAKVDTPVATCTVGPGADVPARGSLPAVRDVADLDTFAGLTADGKRLVLSVVNRAMADQRPLSLDLNAFDVESVSARILTGASPKSVNSVTRPNAVRPQPFPTPAWRRSGWTVTIPPHALVLFTFTRGRA